MNIDVMVDLETLGTGPDAVVVSIGACVFDIKSEQITSTFIMALTIEGQLKAGRKIEADTLKWWFGQSDAAKKVFHEKATPSAAVLEQFTAWLKMASSAKSSRNMWGNGSGFDISIMEDMYKTFGQEIPWAYYNIYDFRTFKRFVGRHAKVEKKGVAHNALDDAISQAEYVMKILKQVEEAK